MTDHRMEPVIGSCHKCSRRIPGERRLCGACAAGVPFCRCQHGIGMHDIRKNGTRSACSVLTGSRGEACGCEEYHPELPRRSQQEPA